MSNRHGPVRTCIGCRERDARSALVRFVLERSDAAEVRVVRDERATMAGRGAWLHDRRRCLELARTRRAFRRAFRFTGDATIRVPHQHDDEAGHVSSPD